MPKTDTALGDLEAFFIKDGAELQAKLRRFAAAGPERMHFVCDFDHTLTKRVSSSDSVGTWGIIDELLPQEGRDRHDAIYKSYRPFEKHRTLTLDQARQWYSQTLDLICSYQINFNLAEAVFSRAATSRQGVAELFRTCTRAKMPTIILSAGVKQMIDLFAHEHGIDPTIIMSTELELTPEGRVTGWNPQTLIHALNKREMGHKELARIRTNRPYVVLLGDTPEDVDMAVGSDDILRICIMDPRSGEKFDQAQFLKDSFDAGYDLVVRDSLEPVARLLRDLTKQ